MDIYHEDKPTPIHEAEPGRLPLLSIRLDGGTQPRAMTETEVVNDYAESMREGVQFPAVIVFYDGQHYWLADGFHRFSAAQQAGLTDINADVRQGTQRDAILYSVGANANHGLRRTNADKQRAVLRLLGDTEWAAWSNREIARKCAVSESLVRSLREKRSDDNQIRTFTTKHGTTATMNTGNIGKSSPPVMPETDEQKRVASLGGKGAKVQHIHSGQVGTLQFMHGNVAYVDTANGQKSYHWRYLKKVESEQPDQPKHWGLANGMAFWTQVHKFSLPRETILEQLQPDAKVLTDLRMTRDDAWVKLNQLATERTANEFPVDSYVQRKDGLFGQVKQAHAASVRVLDLTYKIEDTWQIAVCKATTEAKYLESLEENKPAAEIDLPERQVEFLVALAQGVAVNKNAATRLALRRHGYITLDDDWTQIRLTEAGIEWLRNHGFETPDNAPEIQQIEDNLREFDGFNIKRDGRTTRPATPDESQPYDRMQTPPYALDPLLPYLGWSLPSTIWEPACGEGLIVEGLYDAGWTEAHVIASDILTGQSFFTYQPDKWEVVVTNPPYSLKIEWIERCYALGKPFALLLPIDALGLTTVYPLMQEKGFEIMLLDSRVDFKMPNKGWDSHAQFSTFWLCHDLLPEKVMFGSIKAAKKAFKAEIGDTTDDDPE